MRGGGSTGRTQRGPAALVQDALGSVDSLTDDCPRRVRPPCAAGRTADAGAAGLRASRCPRAGRRGDGPDARVDPAVGPAGRRSGRQHSGRHRSWGRAGEGCAGPPWAASPRRGAATGSAASQRAVAGSRSPVAREGRRRGVARGRPPSPPAPSAAEPTAAATTAPATAASPTPIASPTPAAASTPLPSPAGTTAPAPSPPARSPNPPADAEPAPRLADRERQSAAQPAAPSPAPSPQPNDPHGGGSSRSGETLPGRASWYGPGFAGRTTACGGTFDPEQLTLASRELDCGTQVLITGPTGRSVQAVVTDWGPAEWTGRRFDLSRATFEAIADLGAGVVDVKVDVIASR